jgi:hypothetical protein
MSKPVGRVESKVPDQPTAATSAEPVPRQKPAQETFWLWVFCLLGVDYFSTLSYQPSISYQAAGMLGPAATLLVVLITLFGVLPAYNYLARHSPHGEGVVALLERLIRGWVGKTLILILLGFATTDFVMLKSISLADASEHLLHNSYVASQHHLRHLSETGKELAATWLGSVFTSFFTENMVVTLLLGVVSFLFWFLLRNGFNRNVMYVAVPIVALYLAVNAVVIGCGLWFLGEHPAYWAEWHQAMEQQLEHEWTGPLLGPGVLALILVCFRLLPQLSLGLSGFEMNMILMPEVRGSRTDDPEHPRGRIENTRKILFLAALIMSVYLLGAVVVTTLLIPAGAFGPRGLATNRALAYLANGGGLVHGVSADVVSPLFGTWFGVVYDLSTILILCFAGTSVMTALGRLLPRILLRFGMELRWADRWGVLFLLFAAVNFGLTILFRASVEDQRGAYATGVLAMVFAAAAVTTLHCWRHRAKAWWVWRFPWHYGAITALSLTLLLVVIATSPSGLAISCCFIGTILATSVVSRAIRTDELRTIGFDFVDENSKFLWDSLRLADFPVLVPHRPGCRERLEKEQTIRKDHQLDPHTQIVFLEVAVDDPSNFYQRLMIEVVNEDNNIVVKVTRCASIAHSIAAVALELSRYSEPPGLHFGWSEMDLLAASWSYLAFGEGNVPWKVRELINQAEPDPKRRPRIVIG